MKKEMIKIDMDHFMEEFLSGNYLEDPTKTDSSKFVIRKDEDVRKSSRRKSGSAENGILPPPPPTTTLRRNKTTGNEKEELQNRRRDVVRRSRSGTEANPPTTGRSSGRRRVSDKKKNLSKLAPGEILKRMEQLADAGNDDDANIMMSTLKGKDATKIRDAPRGHMDTSFPRHISISI